MTAALLPLPFFAQAQADLQRLHSAAPNNEFPILKRAFETRNVAFAQVAIGRVSRVADVSPALAIVEGCATAFHKYVDHITVMEKQPAPNPGRRPDHTLLYNQEDFTKTFLLNNREKFDRLNFLQLSIKIKAAREQTIEQKADDLSILLTSAEHIPLLKYFSHYLDAFEFDMTGPGSWDDACDLLEKFRQNGLSMPGDSITHHFDNCRQAFRLLLGELFDAISHFAQSKEASNVALSLSRRVFEANGAFQRHVAFQNGGTSDLNRLLTLNPAFALALGGHSAGAGSSTGTHDEERGSGGKGKSVVKGNGYQWKGSSLIFGDSPTGPKYDTVAILTELQKTDGSLTRENFCMLNFLSNKKNICKSSKHTGAFHKIPPEISKLRQKFEHKPFRIDARAKPKA